MPEKIHFDAWGTLKTRERALSVAEVFLQFAEKEERLKEQGSEENTLHRLYRDFLRHQARNAMETIHRCSESPLESVFLSSLILNFLRNSSAGFVVSGPCPNSLTLMEAARENLKRCDEWEAGVKQYEHKHRRKTLHDLVSLAVADGYLSQDQASEIEQTVLMRDVGVQQYFHINMQANFPNLIPGRTARADVMIWIPRNEKCKVIVECDGYEYHSSKDKFISDRQRDRAFAKLGFHVLRYSGSEVFRNPAAASTDLFEHLTDLYEAVW